MRWDDLFADLEAQADALDVAERAAEVGERARMELATTGTVHRLRAALGMPLRIELLGGLTVTGVLGRVGSDWLLCEERDGREILVSAPALRLVGGLTRATAVPGTEGAVAARLTLRAVLRGIARDRLPVRMHMIDGTTIDATIDRVGADFVDAARHAPGEPRRRGEVRDIALIPLAALAAVRRSAS